MHTPITLATNMAQPQEIPHFSYSLSVRDTVHAVLVKDEIYAAIGDDGEFYRALGYTPASAMRGVMPDEFIWDLYKRDGAAKGVQCLQAQIASYLNNRSERFRNEYGGDYANKAGTCLSDNMDTSAICLGCHMNPFKDIAKIAGMEPA